MKNGFSYPKMKNGFRESCDQNKTYFVREKIFFPKCTPGFEFLVKKNPQPIDGFFWQNTREGIHTPKFGGPAATVAGPDFAQNLSIQILCANCTTNRCANALPKLYKMHKLRR